MQHREKFHLSRVPLLACCIPYPGKWLGMMIVRQSVVPFLVAAFFSCSALASCTDWDAQGGATGPKVVGGLDPKSLDPTGDRGVGGDGGPTPYRTWQAPDAASAKDSQDAGSTGDAGATDASVASVDATPTDAAAPDTLDDAAPFEVIVIEPDGGPAGEDAIVAIEVGPDDAVKDATSDGSSTDVSVYTFDGKADFGGWPDLAVLETAPIDAGPQADGDPADPGLPPLDGGADTMPEPDLVLPPDDVGQDAAPGDATSPDDVASADGGSADAAQPDGAGPDSSAPDGLPSDISISDVAVNDVGPNDAGVTDTAGDGSGATDASSDASSADNGLPDGIIVPDWQGYPSDLPYAADADIYGGPIGSCLSLYLYQQESCGTDHPTAECINKVAKDGSLYSQFLFEPLQTCETAVCTQLCTQATDKSCMEQCIGKYCTTQFLACTSNASIGSANCASTWTCSQQYPDKLLTISAKCYANASFPAQKQFAAMISCSAQPQSSSCIPQVAACYATGPGTASCSETITCTQACNGDQTCANQCIAKGTDQTVSLLDALLSCQLKTCNPLCKGSSDPKCGDLCMQDKCKTELISCITN